MTIVFSKYFQLLFWIGSIALLSSCNSLKYIEDNQTLLTKNKISLITKQKIKNKVNLEYELSTLFKQEANTNLLWIPREWIYFKTTEKVEYKKNGKLRKHPFRRWARRRLSEPPTIHQEQAVEDTKDAMVNYLQRKGYFNASVKTENFNPGQSSKNIQVTYLVYPGKQYTIDTVIFESKNEEMQQALNLLSTNTLLKKGQPVDRLLYNKEVTRITNYLRNNGYAYFYPNFIAPLEGDSLNHKVKLKLEILAPADEQSHRSYRIGNVYVYPDYAPSVQDEVNTLNDTLIGGFIFRMPGNTFRVRPSAITNQIYLIPDSLYRQNNYDKTNQQLGALGTYKFISIKQEIDKDEPGLLNFHIQLTRGKQMAVGSDVDVSFTNPSVGQEGTFNLVGLTVTPSFKHRNMFKGAELMIARAEAGLEMDVLSIGSSDFWNTVDVKIQSDLYIPKFVDYFGFWRMMHKMGRKKTNPETAFYTALKEKSSTHFTASYNLLERLGFFTYNFFNTSFGYDLQKSPNQRYVLNHVGVDLLISDVTPRFDTILMQNPFLAASFGSQLFTSLVFRDLDYVYNSPVNASGGAWQFINNLELSGAEVWAVNSLYNCCLNNTGNDKIFRIVRNSTTGEMVERDTINFSQYIKGQVDGRYSQPLTPKNSLAVRAYGGIVFPFGFSKEVPYVKQFFIGGPNSIRAWRAREIGPGSFRSQDSIFYQTGDIRLELNLEYRFDLFTVFSYSVEGAVFLDAGNVWLLNEDRKRPGSQFRFTAQRDNTGKVIHPGFLDQIAIGTGFGLRLDFSYFLFRFDLGYPLRYPYRFDEDGENMQHWYLPEDRKPWHLINYNIGLGYPF